MTKPRNEQVSLEEMSFDHCMGCWLQMYSRGSDQPLIDARETMLPVELQAVSVTITHGEYNNVPSVALCWARTKPLPGWPMKKAIAKAGSGRGDSNLRPIG